MLLFTALKARRYELIAFLTGAAVMTLEIVGARLIAPYFGTSTYVWTAMIGVILGSLAIGYAVGGRMADRDNAAHSLSIIILMAAALVLVLGLSQEVVLKWLSDMFLDLRLSTFFAAVLLFAPASALIGMVSPHLAKIRITSLQTTGKDIGRLEAAGALGSIAGTFACGYVLLGLFGSRAIVIGVVGLLLVASLLAIKRHSYLPQIVLLVLAIGQAFTLTGNPSNGVIADIDTSYARYIVRGIQYGGSEAIALSSDGLGFQSAVNPSDPDRLVFSYIQQFDAALKRHPNPKSILVIGGGTFTFPATAARQNPDLRVDAVEIDPTLTDVAKDYFKFKQPSNMHIINEDGRTYLNKTNERYDMIFFDAYAALNPPFQLTTAETMALARQLLTPDGAIVSNVIGLYAAGDDPYLQAMRATVASEFRFVQANPADLMPGEADMVRNYVLYGSQSSKTFSALTRPLSTSPIPVDEQALVLRDDFAPIEQLTH